MTVRVLAPAKINLTLDMVGRREDGYHLLESVMQTVGLYDEITVSLADDDRITLYCDGGIPADESNTAYKAVLRFREAVGCVHQGFAVTVNKQIPSQAGLAGGSADAAGVLHALDRLMNTRLPLAKLCEIGSRIGADVPFCVHGGTVLCTGVGEILTPVTPLVDCEIVIVKPDGGVSTPEAYRQLDAAPHLIHPDSGGLCAALSRGALAEIAAHVGNVFEAPLNLPHTAKLISRLQQGGALTAALSGSGSAVFGLFADTTLAHACADALREQYPQTWVCRPCSGVQILE